MTIRLREYIETLEKTIPILEAENKPVDALVLRVQELKSRFSDYGERIDLHDLYLKQAEQPIYPLYLNKFEIFCLQVYGRVPERTSEIYKELHKSFLLDPSY